jgi:hypothetical protein
MLINLKIFIFASSNRRVPLTVRSSVSHTDNSSSILLRATSRRVLYKYKLPPHPDTSVGTPLLEEGGEMSEFKYFNFLLLSKEEYSRRAGGRR